MQKVGKKGRLEAQKTPKKANKFSGVLAGFHDHLIEKGVSPLTARVYASQVNKYYHERGINSSSCPRGGDLEGLVDFVLSRPSPDRRAAVVRFLEFIRKEYGMPVEGVLERVRSVRAVKRDRREMATLLSDDVSVLVRELLARGEGETAVLCMIAFDTGARVRAVLGLRAGDIVPNEDGTARVILREKGGKTVRRLVSRATVDHLERVFGVSEMDEAELLFARGRKRASVGLLDDLYVRHLSVLKRVSREVLGFPVSFHWLRRGAGVEVYRATRDLVAASEFLGHSDPRVTKVYLKIEAEKAEEVIKKRKRLW